MEVLPHLSTIIKYRIHELAKDFGVPSKVINDILAEYGTIPKNHMQILTDEELNFIFERLTRENQTTDINAALMAQLKRREPEKKPEPKAAPEAPKAEKPQEKKAEKPAEKPAPKAEPAKPVEKAPEAKQEPQKNQNNNQRPAAGSSRQSRFENAAPLQQRQPKRDQKKPQQQESRPQQNVLVQNVQDDSPAVAVVSDAPKSAQKQRYVDTRGSSVNLDRYDERVDSLVPDRAQNNMQSSKQKLTKKNNDRRSFGSKRRNEEQEKLKRLQQEVAKAKPLKVMIPDEIAVGELASRLKKTASDVIKQLMKLGVMASISQFIDFDTASLVAMELGAEVEREVIVTIEDRLIDRTEDSEDQLVPRSPVVVVMGHVDHGKTSLLDAIRKTNVAAGEAGGITQHIGAYRVKLDDREITFIDTPGHAAFTEMRARGANITDVVILIVAADDGIMPQTVEAISHAKAAGVPIVVAVNKIDRPNAQPDRVLQQLTEYELVPEEWGGETIVCKISALLGEGIDNLLEMVLLTADMQELKANPDRPASGTVIEARLDRGRGPVATVLVQNGTLHQGDTIIAGKSVGHVRVMTDDRGRRIKDAEPSVPVEIIGLGDVPEAGDEFFAVADERMARELVEQRIAEDKEAQARAIQRVSLDTLFSHIKEGEMKDLNLIVKADVRGTSEAVAASLEKLTNEEVRVRVIHTAVGAINESDVMLANASNAIIIGFNVRPSAEVVDSAKRQNVDIRLYRVIYDCLEEIEAAMKGMLAPKFRENVLGHVEVRQTFKVSGVGTIAGCYVQNGKIVRSCKVRLVRDGVIIHEGELASLKRFKDDAREVAAGYECGCSIEKYNDIKVGDIIESFVMEEIAR
ncbi:MAG: translation initiation factor IF-2 [Ruminococcaceae bacterium]|nr:translation initiation factor IF-2 [Oscillospiraceae bacterium]